MTAGEPRVELRPWRSDDADLLVALLGDPAMTEHLGGPESPDALRHRLDRYLDIAPGDGRMFVITVGDARTPAGSVGYWAHAGEGLETGWSVLPAFQGRGVASRGAAQALDLAAADGEFDTVHAYPSVDNGPSNALCARLGFTRLGERDFEYPKGHWMRCIDWSLDLAARAGDTARLDLVGARVALGPVRRELDPLYLGWTNDPEVGRGMFGAPVSRHLEEERAWFDAVLADPRALMWLVYRLDTARPIGVVGLSDIDRGSGTAKLRMLIGSARARGQGFGREAAELVLAHAVDELGLRTVGLTVYEENAAARRLYEALGFGEVERELMPPASDGRRHERIRMTRTW